MPARFRWIGVLVVAIAFATPANAQPARDDEVTISGLPDSAVGTVKLAVIAQRNLALPRAQDALNQRLLDARAQLNGALHSFDPSMSASFRALARKVALLSASITPPPARVQPAFRREPAAKSAGRQAPAPALPCRKHLPT